MSEMEDLKKIIFQLSERVSILEHRFNIINSTDQKALEYKRDKTKYLYNGVVYTKNRLVLQIVNDYVKQFPNITFDDLYKVFDKSLQGSIGVVVPLCDVKNKPDLNKRFFAKENEILNLNFPCVVCTQWGAFNIVRFIARSKDLGFEISEIK